MAIEKLEDDLNIISALDNEPNDVGGMTADELKASFDRAGLTIQAYINNVLLPGIASQETELAKGTKEYADELAAGFVMGQLSPGSVTNVMLEDPINKAIVYFEEDSWVGDEDKAVLTLDKDTHGCTVPFIMAGFYEEIDGVYHTNTWNTACTCAHMDESLNLVLTADAGYPGRLVIFY